MPPTITLRARLPALAIACVLATAPLAGCGDAVDDHATADDVLVGTATWEGMTYQLERSRCRATPEGYSLTMVGDEVEVWVRGAGDEAHSAHLSVLGDDLDPPPDPSPDAVETYTSTDVADDVDFKERAHAGGIVELEPATAAAEEANPDGGVLELDLIC